MKLRPASHPGIVAAKTKLLSHHPYPTTPQTPFALVASGPLWPLDLSGRCPVDTSLGSRQWCGPHCPQHPSLCVVSSCDRSILAQRKAGVVLKEMAESGERLRGRPKKGCHSDRLSEFGISYTQSSRWMQIAKVPEKTVVRYVAECIKKKQGRTDLTVQRDGQLEIPKQPAFL